MGATTKVTRKGQVTIPAELREKAQIEEGDLVEFCQYGEYLLLKPLGHHENGNGLHEDSPFASPEWKARIEKSLAELDAGLGRVYETEDDFLASLDVD